MYLVIALLRAIHILGGVFWAGSAMTLYGFVMPTAAATRPESGKFIQHFAAASGITAWMTIASLMTVVAGLALASPLGGAIVPGMMRTPRGIALSLGMLLGLATFLEGQFVSAPAGRKLGAIGHAIAEAGGTPSAEQLEQMGELQAKLTRSGTRGAWMLGLTTVLMAVLRVI